MSSLEEKTNRFSNIAIIEIQKTQATEQYTGLGIDIPITHYKIEIVSDLLGEFNSDKFYISYYGGIEVDGDTILMGDNNYDDNKLPETGEFYVIYINNNEVSGKNRIKDGSLVVYDSRMLIKLPDYDSSLGLFSQPNEITRERLDDVLSYIEPQTEYIEMAVILSEPCFVGPDGECVGLPGEGETFGTAYVYNVSSATLYKNYEIDPNEEVYFKVKALNSFKIDIYSEYYSSYTIDVEVFIYDSSYNYISYNDNGGYLNNFSYEHLLNDNEYIYVKVVSNSSTSGLTKIKFDVNEDCFCLNNLDDLLLAYSSVNNDAIVYEDLGSDYIGVFEDAADVWNDLGIVDIRPMVTGETPDLNIDDYEDSTHNAYGYYQNRAGTDWIRYNIYYFDPASDNQKLDTSIHELGHALGIAHMTTGYGNNNISVDEDDANIMTVLNPVTIVLGPCDKLVYFYLYE